MNDPCQGCGACCSSQGTPPGFAIFFPTEGETPQWALDSDDFRFLHSAPAEAFEILRANYSRNEDDRYERGLPCLWYDEVTKRCRFYEHRPDVCREFEPGEPACNDMRKAISLPLIEGYSNGL